MRVLLTLCVDRPETNALMHSMPAGWKSEFADGTIAAGDALKSSHENGDPFNIFIIRRPDNHTIVSELIRIATAAAHSGTNLVIVLSSRDMIRQHPLSDANATDRVTVIEFDRETWTRRSGVWEWEMMYEHLLTQQKAPI